MYSQATYFALPNGREYIGGEMITDEDSVINDTDHRSHHSTSTWLTQLRRSLPVLLAVSILVNFFMFSRSLVPVHVDAAQGIGGLSAALLKWDITTQIRDDSPFGYEDRKLQDIAWSSDLINPSYYTVALDDAYASALQLPRSMRWPWDDEKGIYLTQSGHQFHCLHVLRNSVNSAHYNEPMAWSYHHQIHCLSILVDDLLCNADDMLLYNGYLNANANSTAKKPRAGLGTARQCRDIHKLHAWTRDNSACYDPNILANHGSRTDERDNYKFCPDGSKPWEATAR